MNDWPATMVLPDGATVTITTVRDDAGLAPALAALHSRSAVALDTEFVRERTLYPLLGLIQICQDERVILIDALGVHDWQPLKRLMEGADGPLFICHACGEDLEALQSRLGIVPARLVDTQVAAGFAGITPPPGYGRLVENLLGLTLAKEHARTDWLARPLSAAQLGYAVADVVYLERLWPQLVTTLTSTRLYDACVQECQRLVEERTSSTDDRLRYRAIGNAWHLKPKQLAVLRELAVWRQQLARSEDKPLGHILKDEPLLLLARDQWQARAELERLEWLPRPLVRRWGDSLWAAIERGQQCPQAEWPAPLERLMDVAGYKAAVNWCRQRAEEAGQALGLAPELVASKRLIHELFDDLDEPAERLPVLLSGWRAPFFAPRLDELRRLWRH